MLVVHLPGASQVVHKLFQHRLYIERTRFAMRNSFWSSLGDVVPEFESLVVFFRFSLLIQRVLLTRSLVYSPLTEVFWGKNNNSKQNDNSIKGDQLYNMNTRVQCTTWESAYYVAA